jgi:hypothetical protein
MPGAKPQDRLSRNTSRLDELASNPSSSLLRGGEAP